ncbi:hypothetical protein Zmor_015731 [Zophobas morio]|uniref:Odorant receptor n=1 Tax=Zophobas morio TaxID=2755281 RepID=A0AA38MHN3_9CUCU|nr:hypothetical protein Zmor_015731 [Zophobas morio]
MDVADNYFSSKKIMRGDCLKLIRFLGSDLLQFKLTKICFVITLLVHVVMDLIQIYFLTCVYDNSSEIVLYTSVLLGNFYPMLAIGLLLNDSKLADHIKDDFDVWEIDSAGKKVETKIRQEVKYMTIYIVITFLTTVCGSILFAINLSHDLEWFFALRFFKDYFPNQYTILAVLYKATFICIGYSMIVHAFQIIYYTQHLRYQIMLLNEHILNIGNSDPNVNEEELFYNKEYQTTIETRLRFCIKRWDEYLLVYNDKVSRIRNMVIFYALTGWLLGISFAIVMVSGKLTPDYYPRQATALLALILTFCASIESGQATETQMEEMASVVNEVKWYNFSKHNKKLYFIFAMNIMTERKIQCSENYSVNYILGLAIVRGIYSIGTVFTNMNLK